MNKAIYRYWVDETIIAIEDTGQGLPVTLDAERVLQTIDDAIGPLTNKYVVYADRDGVWDGLAYSKDRLWIYSLGADSYEAAKQKLSSLSLAKQDEYRFKGALPRTEALQDWLPDL